MGGRGIGLGIGGADQQVAGLGAAQRVAVVQTGSVPFDTAATTRRICDLLEDAALAGAELAVFPEATLGTYPKGLTFGAPVGRRTDAGRDEYQRYFDGAVALANFPYFYEIKRARNTDPKFD